MKFLSDESKDGYEEIKPLISTENSSQASSIFGDSEEGSYNSVAAFNIFFFPALGGLLFGYDIGATSAVLTQLQDSGYSGVSWSEVVSGSSLLQGFITSIGMFGAMLGSLTCFKIADDLGRRRSLMVAAVFFLCGSTIEYLSGNANFSANTGISLLLLGRITYGYACGFAMHGAPAYIGEMAPAQIRGVLVSMKEVFIVLGMLLGYSVGYSYSYAIGGWRMTYLWALVPALMMLYGMYNLPYSARWLALQGRVSEAKDAMRFVIPDLPLAEVEALRELALQSSMRRAENRNPSLMDDIRRFRAPNIFPALVAGVGLVIFQQITGQPSVLYYADTLFEDVGMSLSASILIAAFKLVATFVATFTVDKYGRKQLLIWGCSLMFIALFILTIAFMFSYMSSDDCNGYTEDDTCPSGGCQWKSSCDSTCVLSGMADNECTCCGASFDFHKDILLIALFVYIGGYQIGFGPISWLMISEIFPLEVRGKAVSLAVVTNFFWNTVMTLLFPVELEYLGSSLTFALYAIIIVMALYFIYKHVPETKGMTLEEIESYFTSLGGAKNDSSSRLGESGGKSFPNNADALHTAAATSARRTFSGGSFSDDDSLASSRVGSTSSRYGSVAGSEKNAYQQSTPRRPSANSFHSNLSSSGSRGNSEKGSNDNLRALL